MSDPSPENDSTHRPVFAISAKQLRSGPKLSTSLDLCRRAHHPNDLATATISSTAKPHANWTRAQKNATYTLESLLSQWSYQCGISIETFPSRAALDSRVPIPPRRPGKSVGDGGVPSADFMRSLFKPISELFFMGKLDCLPFEWDETLHQRLKFWGVCHTNHLDRKCSIAMDPNWSFHHLQGVQRRDGIVGILLHECIHAWLAIFSCSLSGDPCSQESCRAHHTQHTGLTGHGSSFVQLSRHVQTVAREHVSPGIDLCIDTSIRRENSARKSKTTE